MAPSPIIPTSFVPKQPVRTTGRFAKSGGNVFLLASLALLICSLAGAAGVFAYERYLEGVRDTKRALVEEAKRAIDAATVEDFIRTRDRFTTATHLLDSHVAPSRFFALLERVTLSNVRFNTLTFRLAEDRSATIVMEGVARTFNALAAQSSLLASEREVKRAIFSDIDVNDTTDTVTFSLNAELAPSLLSFTTDAVSVPRAPLEASENSAAPVPTEDTPSSAEENPLSL